MIKWWFLRWVPQAILWLEATTNMIKYVANVAATSMWRVEHWATRINLEGWATKNVWFWANGEYKTGRFEPPNGRCYWRKVQVSKRRKGSGKKTLLTDFILAPGCWQCVCVWLSWLKRCYIIIIDHEWHEAQYHLRNSQLFPSAACHAPSSPAELRCGLKKDSGTSGPNQKPWLQTLELQWLWKGFLGLFSIPSRHHGCF